ncbi:MAG: hypothetical protein ACQESK_05820 [Bacteroidota bacterium]
MLISQELSLKILTKEQENQEIVDSLQVDDITFENAKSIEEFSNELISNLQKKGYINAKKITLKSTEEKKFILEIELNQLIKYFDIKVKPQFQQLTGSYQKLLNDDNRIEISFEQYRSFINTILYELSERGEAFSKVKLTNIEETGKQSIKGELKIARRKKRIINNVYLKGYEDFPSGFIEHKIRIRKGQTFNKAEILAKSNRFEDISFAAPIKDPEAQFTKDSTNIFMYLEKSNSNVFDGFIGFSNNESNNLEINGYVDLQLINNLNLGESLIINYKNDGNEQQRFIASGELPYLFKSPFSVGAGIDIFRKDTLFSTTNQNLELSYQVTGNTKVSAQTSFLNSSISEETNQINEAERANFDAFFYGAGITYSKRKKIIGDFKSTTSASLEINKGKRKTTDETTNQWKAELLAQHHFRINNTNYVFGNINAALINSNNYLNNELFRFGGLRSIRGFAENSLVASLYANLQTEYRVYLSSELYAHSVLDYGYYENSQENLADQLYSFGFGFGLSTNSGVLRLIFANGASKQQDFSFENTQVHLSLNTYF